MKIESLNCRCCGGVLSFEESALTTCKYCGATNMISTTAANFVAQLNRANKLRQEREFDNAARIYDNILAQNVPTPDLLWLRTLCEYGIEYVPDPLTSKYIPTLHRVKDESILAYHEYLDALTLADAETKKVLKEEAEYIAKIQTEYLNIAANEAPYDVFICYKETDEATGEKTEDVQIAEQIYHALTGKGYKVFFSRITLKSKLSIDYEPYIFAALKSARAMIVLGTKAEYFMSVWVKNEWGRYLKLMENNPEKQMFFACDDPEELPRAFATKQAAMLGEEDAIDNLVKNVADFLGLPGSRIIGNKTKYMPKRSVSTPDDLDFESRPDKMYAYALRLNLMRDHTKAAEAIDKLLYSYPEYAQGYWLRLANKNQFTPNNIPCMKMDFRGDSDCINAIRFADDKLSEEYRKIAEECYQNSIYQQEFDQLLEDESIKFIENYQNTESGKKRNMSLSRINKLCDKMDAIRKSLNITLIIGMVLTIIGNGLTILIVGNTHDYLGYVVATLVSSVFIHAGIAILFSYSLPLNIGVNVVLIILSILGLVNPYRFYSFKYVVSILVPITAYCTTFGNGIVNRKRYRMFANAFDLIDALKELKVHTEGIAVELRQKASELLGDFKKNKGIEKAIIELKDDDYFKALEKIDKMYLADEKRANIRVGYVMTTEEMAKQVKSESQLGIVALVLSFCPFANILGVIIGLYDICIDKEKLETHWASSVALIIGNLYLISGYLLYVYR